MKKRAHTYLFLACLVILVLGDLFFFQSVLATHIRRAVGYIYIPVSAYVSPLFATSPTQYFTTHASLRSENARLRSALEELERQTTADRLAALEIQSEDSVTESVSRLSASDRYAGIAHTTASVYSYVDYPFGTLGIVFRTPLEHTSSGQLRYVFDERGTCIGVLDWQAGKFALVRLFSRSGEEHLMRVGESELALVKGRGGVTLEAVVPKTTVLNVGDPVSIPDAANALVGIVGEVRGEDTDTTHTVLIRLATTPRAIQRVFLFEE